MNSLPLLDVQNFSLSIGHHLILDQINLTILRGAATGLVGESGSGKSMLAKSILQLATPGTGKILLKGENLLDKTEKELQKIRGKKIAYICQNPMNALNPLMNIGNQLSEGMIMHEGMSKKAALALAENLLKEVGMPDPLATLKCYPDQLSGGMRQRVVIAMALACRPDLLIADEPTTSLDVTTQAEILNLLAALQQRLNMSLLLITHDLAIVAGCCKHVVVLRKGRVLEQGSTEQIFYRPSHEYTKKLCWKYHDTLA